MAHRNHIRLPRLATQVQCGKEMTVVSQIVKCDVCGGVYNQSHLSSHKRLSHGKGKTSSPCGAGEPPKFEAVLASYAQLSEEDKKEVRKQLADPKKS